MFKKEKTVIFGVSDPKSVRFEHVPNRVIFVGDVKILAIWGGNAKIEDISPPFWRGLGGKYRSFSPPILEGCGGEISGISPPYGGETEKILRNQTPQISISL